MERIVERLRPWLTWVPVERLRHPPPTVAVLRLSGPIGQIGSLRTGMSLARIGPLIERAFALPQLKAVAIAINSPGGSAAQAALIAKRIRDLASEKKVPVVAFAEDVAASGGYWIACAADEIYADANSIIGSIGVIAAGFGFTDLLRRIGVQRRVYTAGDHKSMLDPFQPEQPEDIERLRAVQHQIHQNFQDWVRIRRGDRLKGLDGELFSGEFWVGPRALELGLIDGIDDMRSAMRRRFGDQVRLRTVSPEASWMQRWLRMPGRGERGGAEPPIAEWTDELLSTLEAHALWARFGL